MQPERENSNTLPDKQVHPSCLPPIRNPFKADKTVKDSEWTKLQRNAKGIQQKDSEASHGNKETVHDEKENVGSTGAVVEEGAPDTLRGKNLPPGMKIKKRVSDEERNCLRAPSEQHVDKTQENTKVKHHSQTAADDSRTSCEEKSLNPKESQHQPTDADHSLREKSDPSHPKSSDTNTSTDSASENPTSNKSTNNEGDDDVVFVSVKPSTQNTPPSTIQKTLTTFPGFQLASKVKVQVNNHKGMHSLLTAQLEQKKVSKSQYRQQEKEYYGPFESVTVRTQLSS